MGSKAAVKERTAEAAPVDAGTCRHHWLIESPRGALSTGRCKLCGEQREFRNSSSDYIWDDDSSSSGYGSSWGGVRSSTPKAADDDEMTTSSSPGEQAAVVL